MHQRGGGARFERRRVEWLGGSDVIAVGPSQAATAAAAAQQRRDPRADPLDHASQTLLVGHLEWHEPELPAAEIAPNHAVEGECVEVDVEVQRAAETLDRGHGANLGKTNAGLEAATQQEAEHRAHEDVPHSPAEIAVEGDLVPQSDRHREHPLPHWNVRQHAIDIDEVRRGRRHPAPAA